MTNKALNITKLAMFDMKCLLMFSFFLVVLSGCSQMTDSKLDKSISLMMIDLNDRQCGDSFYELELYDGESYSSGAGEGLAVSDLNNDGLIDIFFVNAPGNSSIFWNKGDLEFEREIFTLGHARNVNLIDYNGDGKIDIFVTFINEPPVLFENYKIGNKTAFRKTAFNFSPYVFSSDWTDIDLDGDLDLVTGYYDPNDPTGSREGKAINSEGAS